VNWGAWARSAFYLAPLPTLVQVALFVVLWNHPEYPQVAIGVTLVTAALVLTSVFWGKRARLRAVAPVQRRRYASIWLAHYIGMVLVALTVPRMIHPATPEEWFVIYALWLVLAGCTFFSLAPNAGILYVTGGLCFLVALLAPLVAFYLPIILGALISLNMVTLGFLLRRVARAVTAP
jgi:hypothetical protein